MFKVFIQVSTFLSSLLSSLLSCLLPISQPASPLRQNRPVLSDILEALKLLFLLRSSCSPDTGCWIGRTQPGVFGHWVAPETESRWSYTLPQAPEEEPTLQGNLNKIWFWMFSAETKNARVSRSKAFTDCIIWLVLDENDQFLVTYLDTDEQE